jgi:Tol biopolymer transport system component
MRAFIGEVRAENGVDYDTALFVADIPDDVDITTAFSGDNNEYPLPPAGIAIRRLTHSGWAGGIVRGSFDGKRVAYFSKDKKGVKQVFVIDAIGSDLSEDKTKQPRQLTNFKSDASAVRWHPSNNWVFSINNGNITVTNAKPGDDFGKTVMLTNDNKDRGELVVSPDGNLLAYTIFVFEKGNKTSKKQRQIFVLEIDWDELN